MDDTPDPPDGPLPKTFLLFVLTVALIAVAAFILIRMD
jgi:hypothetical protein